MLPNSITHAHSLIRLFSLVILGVALGLLLEGRENRLSFAFFDFMQRQTQLTVQDQVALVVVDQNALNQLHKKKGLVHPFPRELYGAVARVAGRFSARAIFYDILFTEPSFYGVSDDENFARLLKESQVPVVLPDDGPSGSIQRPVSTILPAVTDFALVSTKNDDDGIYRRYLGGNSVANVVAKMLLKSGTVRTPDFLRYYSEHSFPHKNLFEILAAYDDLEDGVPVKGDFTALKNKVWVVGYAAPGLLDMKPIPTDPRAPGFIIPATGVANALSGHGLTSGSRTVFVLLLLLTATLSLGVVKLSRDRSWTFIALGCVLLFFPSVLSILLWHHDTWLSPVPLFVAGLCAGGGELYFVYRTVWREQNRMANMIKHSMSANMVDLVRSGQVQVSRFGELKPVTVLFSDLAGFTELSEALSPQQLVEVLNGYFDEVVNLVTTGEGYVDKFIGDAVMAFWGAPVSQDNHAQLAFHAAVHFHRAAERYNEKLEIKFPGVPRLGTRVGLHSGIAVVGNIGASQRHNYTAIGDTVNVAARLESLCKYYGVELIMSESVLQESGFVGRRDVVELDHVVVKGKKESTRIFTFVSDWDSDSVDRYRRALALYYQGKWQDAIGLLEQSKFNPSRVILNRCQQCLTQGVPSELFRGVWSFDSK